MEREAIPPALPPREHVFRKEGEYWTILYDGIVCRLKDRVGLRHLAQLLANPGRDFLALDLAQARVACTTKTHCNWGDAGTLLDERAKVSYRRRLAELSAEVEEATAFADAGRAARAQEEIDSIAREVARSLGLRGRDRRFGSCVERARVNVTRAIQSAIRLILTHHPALGRHLGVTVRTGTFCVYLPDPRVPIDWLV